VNKRTIAAAGTSVALAAAGFALSTAGSASAATAKKAPAAITIAAKTSHAKGTQCGYPVNRPHLTLGPNGKKTTKGSTVALGGTVACNGSGVAGITPNVVSKTASGMCSASTASGAYSCSVLIPTGSIVHTKIVRAQSDYVHVFAK